ncbi:MAG: glutathione S-transferase family protein [Aliishimia sp.]
MYKMIGTVRSRAFRPMWLLEEIGETYEIMAAGPRSPEILKYNPLGKIPALLDGEHCLTDSVAIMTYLADKHGKLTAPAGTPERAKQDAITLWLIDEFDALLWTAAKHSFVYPEEARVTEIIAPVQAEFARNLDRFEAMIQGDFVMGDAITIPDILAVHCLNWAIGMNFPLENAGVNDYAKRLRSRAAFKAVRARDTA